LLAFKTYPLRLLTSKNGKEALDKMKFFAILSAVAFAAFAVAGPAQGKDQVEKRQVYA
jgi:hypothetical protein